MQKESSSVENKNYALQHQACALCTSFLQMKTKNGCCIESLSSNLSKYVVWRGSCTLCMPSDLSGFFCTNHLYKLKENNILTRSLRRQHGPTQPNQKQLNHNSSLGSEGSYCLPPVPGVLFIILKNKLIWGLFCFLRSFKQPVKW